MDRRNEDLNAIPRERGSLPLGSSLRAVARGLDPNPSPGATPGTPLRQRFLMGTCVFVLVQDGPSILLLRRSGTGWQDGRWSLPAGGLEAGETLSSAASRELLEETTLVVEPSDLELIHVLHCSSGDSGAPWLGMFFRALKWSGTPGLAEPHKHDRMEWHSLDSLPDTLIPYTRQGITLGLSGQRHSDYGWS